MDPGRQNDTSFAAFVAELEQDPDEKARLDEARERLRRQLNDDGDEDEAYVS